MTVDPAAGSGDIAIPERQTALVHSDGSVAELLGEYRAATDLAVAEEVLRALCDRVIRERRVDLLLAETDRIRALPDGVERNCALAIIATGSGDLQTGLRLAARVLAGPISDQHDAETVLLVLSEIALAAAALAQWVTVLTCVNEGRALLTRLSSSSVTRQCGYDFAGLAALAECHTLSGDTEFRALRDTIAPVRARHALTAEHALALVCLGSVQSTRNHRGEAALNLSRGIALTPVARAGVKAHASIELCLVRVRQGRWDDADDAVRDLTSAFDAVDNVWLDPQILAIRGLLFAIRGDTKTAIPLLDHAAVLARDIPTVAVTTVLLHARISIAIAQNDWTRLQHLLDDAEGLPFRRPYTPGEWTALRLLATWHLRNTVEYKRRLAEWSLHNDTDDSPYYWAFLAILAEAEGRFTDGVATIHTALTRVSPDDDPLGRAWVRIVAGTYLTRHGDNGAPDPVHGLAVYEEAYKELLLLGATGYATLCEAVIEQTNDELSRARKIDPAVVLTEQQLRVAHLVSAGYTSTEISDILHLSRKTVDFHVANILRRLNIDSRREIIRLIKP